MNSKDFHSEKTVIHNLCTFCGYCYGYKKILLENYFIEKARYLLDLKSSFLYNCNDIFHR